MAEPQGNERRVKHEKMGPVKRETADLWVGISICLTIALLLVALHRKEVFIIGQSAAAYTLEASFSDIGGLKVAAPVRSAGVLVGRVRHIRFDNKTFQAIVSLSIDQRHTFPIDTSASILSSGLLGESYVNLDAGSEAGKLLPNATIAATRSAIVIEDLVRRFLSGDGQQQGAGARPGPK